MLSTISVEAAHFEKPVKKQTLRQTIKTKKKVVKSFFKKIKKTFSKKIKHKSTDDDFSKGATAAVIIGAISFFLLFLPFIIGVFWVWILAGILALTGDIIAIRTLSRIIKSGDIEAHKQERILAIIGLILSLLTGLIPLALLFLVILG